MRSKGEMILGGNYRHNSVFLLFTFILYFHHIRCKWYPTFICLICFNPCVCVCVCVSLCSWPLCRMPNRKESRDANDSMTVDETSLVLCVCVCVYIDLCKCQNLLTPAVNSSHPSAGFHLKHTNSFPSSLTHLTNPLSLWKTSSFYQIWLIQGRSFQTLETQQSLYSLSITRATVDFAFALISLSFVLFLLWSDSAPVLSVILSS